MRLYGVVGWKNNGKTTLVERLVTEITGRGLTVSTIKHAHHGFDIDAEGKDSHRHRLAGASEVMIGSGVRWALLHELRDAPEPPLKELLARLSPVDLVIVEGYKRDTHRKVEVRRADAARSLIADRDPTVRALATDTPVEGCALPQFDLDAVARIADFILADAEPVPWP